MKYCKKCLMPDTRPNIYFYNDGIWGPKFKVGIDLINE